MAPALTQTGEPPNLADTTTCHTPDSNTNTPVPYDNLKELTGKPNNSINNNNNNNNNNSSKNTASAGDRAVEFFTPESNLIITNGDCVSSGLAPPACGWAEGRPLPNTSPCQSNMDEQSPLHLVGSGNACTSSSEHIFSSSNSVTSTSSTNMGLQSCLSNIEAVSNFLDKGTEIATTTPALEDSSTVSSNQNELLALVGRDFDNVNDIIDTLQRLASNPELLDAAARDLEPESSSSTATTTSTTAPSSSTSGQHASPTPHVATENKAEEIQKRCADQQRKLERRRLFLQRRLQRVTARGLGMTVSSQLSFLTRHANDILKEERVKQAEREKAEVKEPLTLDMLHKESMKSMSTSDLISLVRRVEASNNLQRMNNDRKAKSDDILKDELLLRLPTELCTELDTVATEMKSAVLTHVSHDSDATESSSGGESCDETEVYSCIGADYKPIRERAFYKYCRTRGWIASKWMWLQAQIADLDYRILQQQKIYSHIQKTKGAVQLSLEETESTKGAHPVRNPAYLDMQDPALTCIGSPIPRTVINGYHPPSKGEDVNSLHGYSSGGEGTGHFGCARTYGVEKVKRRRYVRPNVTSFTKTGAGFLNNSTNKILKTSPPVLCKCIPPLTCIICVKSRTTVKNNVYIKGNLPPSNSNKLGPGAFSNMPMVEKLERIDNCFHPVLSRLSETLQGELLSSTLKSSEWQQRNRANKSYLTPQQKEDIIANSSRIEPLMKKKKREEKEHKRNGRRKHSKEETKERITLKLKKSMMLGEESEKESRETKRRRIERRNSIVATRRTLMEDEGADGDDESNSWHVSVSGSAHSSPCPSPALPEKGAKIDSKGSLPETRNNRKYSTVSRQKQNATSSSYDINNIVIPYSMAASSRVELLQYKEIPTPKWRIIEIFPSSHAPTKDDFSDEMEDISDEAIASRHSRSEEEERKKYQNYHKALANSRSTRTRRADSSGTNTPDHPLSPRPSEPAENSVGSPPDTPPVTSMMGSSDENTVLTLSLSSLQTSLLKSNPPSISVVENGPSTNTNSSSSTSSVSSKCQQKSSSSSFVIEGAPAMRTRRSLSGLNHHQVEKIRSTSLNEEQCEKDRLSPFPSRSFPLDDLEYNDLVCESETNTEPTSNSSSLSASGKVDQEPVPSVTIPVQQGSKEETVVTSMTDDESGRDSPLSELTDSAPEEEGFWEDGRSSPDWTISAVNDHCGGFVLTVHKN